MNIEEYVKGAIVFRNLMFTYYDHKLDITMGQALEALTHSIKLSKEENEKIGFAMNKMIVDYFKNIPEKESWHIDI